jgi:lipopolysaccharide/colanic/teichoic acid biosynthesis glycosyltransferase
MFCLYKFRTMTAATGGDGRLLPDRQRLTPLGRFLRRASLDELPQLWNVLKGDMSLVGPRPLVAEYLPRYSHFQRRRLEVKPGLTGWAQIQGRNRMTWEDKFQFDVWYVDHRSFWLDLRILARTVGMVCRGTGVESQDGTPMPEFLGSGVGHP